MTAAEGAADFDPGARRLMGSMLEHPGLPVERLPGLAAALEDFIAEAAKSITPLVSHPPAVGSIERVRATTLFQAIGDCAGLTAAIYASAGTEARMLISIAPGGGDVDEHDVPRVRTVIERTLVEEFARGLGRAMEAGFAPATPLSLSFEGLATLDNAFALARRDTPAAAARFSLPMSGGACEGLVLIPQPLLLPFRKELERGRAADTPSADRRWSNSMESGLKQTRLPVTAILEELSMRLDDVANFRVGVVLPLRSGDFDSVRLECGGRGMFLCRLGQGDGRYRLEIETSIAGPAEPSSI
jgi:hypothetical protein